MIGGDPRDEAPGAMDLTWVGYEAVLALYPEVAGDLADVAKWMECGIEELSLCMAEEPMAGYSELAARLLDSHRDFPDDARRTRRILRLLKEGERQLPVFVDDRDGFLMEGRHRVVAFKMAGVESLTVVRVRRNEGRGAGHG